MPVWLADLSKALLSASPTALVVVIVAYLIYRIARQLLNSPLGAATLIGLLAGKERRKDARELVRLLCGRPSTASEDPDPQIAPTKEADSSGSAPSSGPPDGDGKTTATSPSGGDP
ncbi:hypothetical protein Adu01nite_94180 [Paractinoplanes durhamensis]|uniref:Uncharacterized protein n=1 Tax=Paractinoplanes durhamensis TaxID=113563 RepID=A0ABQ3ZDZ6_9ACTN|nr:hypothetical protein Adu01nite_94180 [Actinoplanes durhamensis]